jgi:hypothetical protein
LRGFVAADTDASSTTAQRHEGMHDPSTLTVRASLETPALEPHANLRLIRTLATVTRSVAPRPADDTSTEDRTGAHIAAPPRHSPRLGLLLNRDGDRVRAPNVGW